MKKPVKIDIKDWEGLLLGFSPRPNRKGFESLLDSFEDKGKEKNVLDEAEKMKGHRAYFYIFKGRDKKYWKEINEWKRFRESNKEKLGRIAGEGLIKDVKNHIITFQYITHYSEYVDIDDIQKLSKRIKNNGWNKSIIRLSGLPLTKDECNEISKKAGIVYETVL